jgi:hypothetical protein
VGAGRRQQAAQDAEHPLSITLLAERPAWHAEAACRGDGRWLADHDDRRGQNLEPLRLLCRACPVAGACLEEAIGLPTPIRHLGVLRAGITGPKAWRFVEAIVADFGPCTATDWADLAAWCVDGDLAELDQPEVTVGIRMPRDDVITVKPPKPPGVFPTMWHYDPVAAGRGFTRVEITVARA